MRHYTYLLSFIRSNPTNESCTIVGMHGIGPNLSANDYWLDMDTQRFNAIVFTVNMAGKIENLNILNISEFYSMLDILPLPDLQLDMI